MGGYVSQNVGRRNGLILSAILLIVSAIGSAIPDKMNFMGKQVICMFMFYRLIGGIGVGLASMLSPMYIAEIAPAKIRGRLVSYNQFAIIFGMVLVSIVNYLIAKGQPQAWIDAAGGAGCSHRRLFLQSFFFYSFFWSRKHHVIWY